MPRSTRRRKRHGRTDLIRFGADVVVPLSIRAEIAVLKGIVATFVMSKNTRQPIYAQQRQILTTLADLLYQRGPAELDPGFAEDWRDAGTDDGTAARGRRPGGQPHRPVGTQLVRTTRPALMDAARMDADARMRPRPGLNTSALCRMLETRPPGGNE